MKRRGTLCQGQFNMVAEYDKQTTQTIGTCESGWRKGTKGAELEGEFFNTGQELESIKRMLDERIKVRGKTMDRRGSIRKIARRENRIGHF